MRECGGARLTAADRGEEEVDEETPKLIGVIVLGVAVNGGDEEVVEFVREGSVTG
jgi:hypothetical protein